MTDITPQGTPATPGTHGHETRDTGIRPILIFGVALTAVTILLQVALGGWLEYFRNEEKKSNVDRPELFADKAGLYPGPEPKDNPNQDLAPQLDKERTILRSYGWVEPGKVARIPIDRAIDLLAERGLPARDAAAPAGGAEAKPSDGTK